MATTPKTKVADDVGTRYQIEGLPEVMSWGLDKLERTLTAPTGSYDDKEKAGLALARLGVGQDEQKAQEAIRILKDALTKPMPATEGETTVRFTRMHASVSLATIGVYAGEDRAEQAVSILKETGLHEQQGEHTQRNAIIGLITVGANAPLERAQKLAEDVYTIMSAGNLPEQKASLQVLRGIAKQRPEIVNTILNR